MKHLKLGTLLLAAALFTGLGVTTLSACDSCGCASAKEVKKAPCDCSSKKLEKKACDSKEAPEAKGAMKCGAGKCGSK